MNGKKPSRSRRPRHAMINTIELLFEVRFTTARNGCYTGSRMRRVFFGLVPRTEPLPAREGLHRTYVGRLERGGRQDTTHLLLRFPRSNGPSYSTRFPAMSAITRVRRFGHTFAPPADPDCYTCPATHATAVHVGISNRIPRA